jgi:hypothetical protein
VKDIREFSAAPPSQAAHSPPGCNPPGVIFEGWTRIGRWIEGRLYNNKGREIYPNVG